VRGYELKGAEEEEIKRAVRGAAVAGPGRWRTPCYASPSKTSDIARAALVLSHSGHGYIT
jgi:hypothetical protein